MLQKENCPKCFGTGIIIEDKKAKPCECQQKSSNSENIKKSLSELYKKIDSLSPKAASVLQNFVEILIEKTNQISLEEKGSQTFSAVSEVKEIPYRVDFFCLHGLESVDEAEKLYFIVQDAAFKIEALFSLVSLTGNMLVGGHHRLNSEEMMDSLDKVGQIGLSIAKSIQTPLENLYDLIEVSEVRND